MARSKVNSSDFLKFMDNEEDSQRVPFSPPTEKKLSQTEAKVEPTITETIKEAELKLEPKLSQTEAKLESEPKPSVEPKLGQSRVKLEPNIYAPKKLEPKVKPQPEPLHEPKLSQTEVKVEPIQSILALVGLQRNILIFLFENCQTLGSRITNPISISNIAMVANTTVSSARKALQRLEQKNFIARHSYKDGRGGFTTYELPTTTYNELIHQGSRAKVKPNLSQSEVKVRTQLEPQPEPTALISSIKDLKRGNTNTGNESIAFVIPENLKAFGVGQRNLENIHQSVGLTVDEIQSSLEHFSWDVEAGIIKKNHLNLLMGILRKKNVYISSGFSQQVEKDLNDHLTRIATFQEQQKQLAQIQLEEKFKTYLESNPSFLDEVKKTTGGNFQLSDEMLKKLAFSRWSEQNPIT